MIMEKQLKLKTSKMLKILPKAVTAVSLSFQNHPFSPGRDHHKSRQKENNATNKWVRPHGGGGNKGFSGPIGSIIPNASRRKSNNNGGNDYQEPTSPKISCMGQIKHNKKHVKKAKAKNNVASTSSNTSRDIEVKKHVTTFRRMLFHVGKQKSKSSEGEGRRKSDASAVEDRVPHVSQMKRFASGRDTFANFDWKAQVASEEIDYYSDEDRVQSDSDEEEEDDEAIIIPFSAPILVGGGGGVLNLKPRKEINLWKRRTMAPPRHLQLDPVI